MHHHRQNGLFQPRAPLVVGDTTNEVRQAVVEVFLQQVVAQALQMISGSPPNTPPASPPRVSPRGPA